MRGDDLQQPAMFSYVSPEQRVPREHPLRPIEFATCRRWCLKTVATRGDSAAATRKALLNTEEIELTKLTMLILRLRDSPGSKFDL
jgi:hypothetical protein